MRIRVKPKPLPTLREGDRDPKHVVYIQRVLGMHPVSIALADGVLDGTTVKYVRELQRHASLPDTGVVDSPTWNVLLDQRPRSS